MAVVIGSGKNAKLVLPKGSADWSIGDMFEKGQYDNLLLLSFALRDQEVVDIRRCFEETTHIFSFGRNVPVTSLQVSLLMFLYKPEDCEDVNYITPDEVRKQYDRCRIYRTPQSMTITMDDFTVSGFLVEMTLGDVNPSNKTSVVTFTFILDQEI